MDMMFFARRLDRVRRQMNWSQRQLAAVMGVGQPSISKYLQGRSLPSLTALYRLARTSGYRMEWFMSDEADVTKVAEAPAVYGAGKEVPIEQALERLPEEARQAFETLIRSWPYTDNILI
ncbi:MAG: XRE family transcriptional regulator [Calditrichaeota bacterium]|nr:MAG: XRE family transcriptional regulator [Calditrichota bacterium]